MHYYQHHIGDFIKDTSFLTNEEVGIYLKLLWLYYDTEKPLPNSIFELSMKVSAREQEDTLSGLLEMFFTLQNGAWHHTRCDKEIKNFHQQLDSASKAGKASAAKRAMNKGSTGVERALDLRSTDVQPTNNQEPLTINHKPNKNTVAPPFGVTDSVWQDWVKLRKAKKAAVTQTAIDGIQREADKAMVSLQAALEMCCERGWTGFKAEWLQPKQSHGYQDKNLGAARAIFGDERKFNALQIT
jgi:uncharacterized protein YdaU (DUF1376 family)